jgi:hypothetical protein
MRANIPIDRLSQIELLADWKWLLKGSYVMIAMNNFGDIFLRQSTGEIRLLRVGSGDLEKIADSQAEFQSLVAEKEKQREWFALELLTEIEREGMTLAPGQCFSLKKPLTLGGTMEVSNIEVASIAIYVSLMGQMHRQLKDLPPGTRITGLRIE